MISLLIFLKHITFQSKTTYIIQFIRYVDVIHMTTTEKKEGANEPI